MDTPLDGTPPPPAWAEVDLAALAGNLDALRRRLPPGVAVYGVVKADAYGHGAEPVARTLQAACIDGLVVGDAAEGAALRRAGVDRPILVIEPPRAESAGPIAAHRLTATVTTVAEAELLAAVADRSFPLAVHVRVDTGFGGFGASPVAMTSVLGRVSRTPGLRLEGLYTHLAGAYQGDGFAACRELGRFAGALALADAAGLRPPLVHALTSPGVENGALLGAARCIGCTMVRSGASLYGLRMVDGAGPFPYRPALQLAARVTRVATLEAGDAFGYGAEAAVRRGTRVATVSFGFSHGGHLLRLKGGCVLIRGRRVPVLGAAFMNCLLADVGAVPDAAPGDEAVLIGRQGDERITAEDLAQRCGVPPSALGFLGTGVVRRHRDGSDGTGEAA